MPIGGHGSAVSLLPNNRFNWFPGSAWEPISRGSASLAVASRKIGGRASISALPGRAWERVVVGKRHCRILTMGNLVSTFNVRFLIFFKNATIHHQFRPK
jgi:hypothetical protein